MIECVTFYGDTKLLPKERLSFRPSVYGLLVDNGKILVVQNRNSGKYSLPGGGVEIGEKIKDALLREIQEETGITVEVKDFLDFCENFFYYDPEDLGFHGFCFFYRCTPLSFDFIEESQIQDGEASNPQWKPIEEMNIEDFQHNGNLILEHARAFQ